MNVLQTTHLITPHLILADDRERNADLLDTLRDHPNLILKTQRLPIGDYLIDQRLLIERKTLPDFIHSIIDGRLFSQASRLKAQDLPSLMILEGTRSDLSDQHMSREAIQGALITLTLIYGIPLLRSRNPMETAHMICMAADQTQRHAQSILHRPGASPAKTRKAQSYLLQGLPGIGKALSQKILQHFPTLKAAFNADVDQWQEIPGIGSEKAKAISELLEAQMAKDGKSPSS